MAYGAQLASLGFISTYLWACASAPFFLRRRGALRWHHVAVSVSALGIFGFALAASVYPAPPAPWNVLPYIFAGTVAAGVALSWALGIQSRPVDADQPV
jgi:hypothetical protein